MVNWDKIEQELVKINLPKTFRRFLTPEELEALNNRIRQGAYNFSVAQKLLEHQKWSFLTAPENALLKLIYILFLTEGPLGFYINCYIYGLILEGHHDIWLEDRQKFASSFEEIVRVPLTVKLRFLVKHGFKSFSKICPKDVRNAIAHQNFVIEPDGTIFIERRKISKKESEKIIHNLVEFLQRTVNLQMKR